MARLICGEKGSVLFCDSGETIVKENGEEKKQTNADRIRSMSDEEPNEFMRKAVFCGGLIAREESSAECRECELPFCSGKYIEWLQSEVEEE